MFMLTVTGIFWLDPARIGGLEYKLPQLLDDADLPLKALQTFQCFPSLHLIEVGFCPVNWPFLIALMEALVAADRDAAGVLLWRGPTGCTELILHERQCTLTNGPRWDSPWIADSHFTPGLPTSLRTYAAN